VTQLTQRDRLRARQLPTRSVRLPADPVAYAAAETAYTAAQVAAKGVRGQERLAQARAELEAQHVEEFTVRALPPDDWEALRALHPPTEEQRAQGWLWDASTLRPELLAASIVPADGEQAFTADEWREFARDGRVTAGEQDLLLATAIALNTRALQVGAGKG
jgi:hypothetical protein